MEERDKEENYWIVIPPQIAGLDNLPSGAKLVFGRIFALSQKNGYCWAWNDHIAKGTGLTKRTVSTYIPLLHKMNLIKVILKRNEQQVVIDRKIFVGLFTPPLTEQGTSPNGIVDLPERDRQYNRVKDKSIKIRDTIEENVLPPTRELLSSKQDIVPLTDLERWEMAKELDVPLWIVKQTDENFWGYIEDPKNRKKYKTSYKTIHRWITMKLQKGEFQHCSETEKLYLDQQHPDLVKQRKEVFEWARKVKLTE